MIKPLLYLLAFILPVCAVAQPNGTFTRKAGLTDSFDITLYNINLDLRDAATKKITGITDVSVTATANGLTRIQLDLLKLQVTEITINSTSLTYTYDDTVLLITLDKTYNAGENFIVQVRYEGTPQTDKLWGGFYFTGVYAFNLGVGFDAKPHSYGRVWFPCLDNFVSKSLYKFSVTTTNDKRAMCNGLLTGFTSNFDGSLTWNWELNDKIPAYLAAVAVAPYEVLHDTCHGINGATPVTLAAVAADTANMRASFKNLKGAFEGFEKWYGVHRFERVGFNVVPFNGGAMEHATNIAYPAFAVDGTVSQETLMAHEFSHHWWGDNTTCKTPEDMWLNEGWASYSENLFLEHVYSKQRYKEGVADNHYDVVRWAHLRDGQPWPVSGVPHAYTYGAHVYNKGADMVHTLRGYMGDAAFEAGAIDFQNKHKYSSVTSEDLKNTMQPHTTANLTAFFNNWIYTAGFPAFSAYIISTAPAAGQYTCSVKVHQQLRFTNKTYTGVPLELVFMDATGATESKKIALNTRDTLLILTLPINPKMVIADRDELLSDAVTENEFILQQPQTYNYSFANATVQVTNAIPGGQLLRIEQHWTAPVTGTNPYPRLYLSSSRYWRMLGTFDSLPGVTTTLVYDGSTPGGYTSGWLDNDLIRITEDSLVLLYRANPSETWQLYPYYQKNSGSTLDKRGNMVLQKILLGEYVFAMYDKQLGTGPVIPSQGRLEIYPNPTGGLVTVAFDDIYKNGHIRITDLAGRTIQEISLYPGQNSAAIDTFGWKPGVYYVSFAGDNTSQTGKLVVR